jgi:hypothetical protein
MVKIRSLGAMPGFKRDEKKAKKTASSEWHFRRFRNDSGANLTEHLTRGLEKNARHHSKLELPF